MDSFGPCHKRAPDKEPALGSEVMAIAKGGASYGWMTTKLLLLMRELSGMDDNRPPYTG